MGLVANGEYKEAVKLVKEVSSNCRHLLDVSVPILETACRRQMVEEPISIAFIKSFIGDRDLASGDPYIPELAPSSGHTVAVVGGRPCRPDRSYQLKSEGP